MQINSTETEPASCKMCTEALMGVKQQEHDVDHLPPSSVEIKGIVKVHFSSHPAFLAV